jgi:serine/threonine-protein kinase
MTEEWGQINPGTVIDGKYRITRLLGTGGMGAVYEGENVRIRRKVAIKMLHLSVSTQADVVKRFEREAQASALVGSEHICEVLDLGVLADGTRYMVMEYLDGETLSGRIKHHGRLMPYQSIPLLLQILEALGAAHAAGIIHRDLKPDNVFILPQRSGMKDFIKILDFGVSKFAQTGGEEMNVTRAGAVVGTPYYMSPEQAKGSSAIDARTDVYAIGVLLYQATTGQVPYQAETFNELLFKIVLEVAPPPQTYVPDIDPEFAGIILRAMAREPELRFQSCAEFAAALQSFHASRSSAIPAAPAAPPPARAPATQVLDLANMPPLPAMAPQHIALNHPTGASWPGNPPMIDPTMPMQSSPIHSTGPTWAQASGAGAAQAPTPGSPSATSASWGNASTATAPRSRTPMILGAIGVVVVFAGLAIALVVATGKPKAGAASSGGAETAAPTTTAAPTAIPTAIESAAPTASASAAPSSAPTAAPIVVPTTKATVTPPTTAKSSKPPVVKAPGPTLAPRPGKPTKPGDLGY